jgi:ABC-2 type transport system permease protein
MTWQAVARKDFEDAVRSRWLWGLSVLFVGLIGAVPAVLFGYYTPPDTSADVLFGASGSIPLIGLSLSYAGILAFVIAFIALVSSHGALIDERESGTLKLLLSLPHSRFDVIAGKSLGRAVVVALPVLAGFLVAGVALVATSTSVTVEAFVPQVALTLLVAAVFVSLGTGVSAASASNRQATLGIFGLYFLLAFLWALFAQGFSRLVNEALKRVPNVEPLGGAASAELRLFVKYLNPLRAYETLVATLYTDSVFSARMVKAGFFEQRLLADRFCPDGLAQSGQGLCQGGVDPVVPWYFSDVFVFLVLVVWLVGPPLVGYWTFRGQDL